MVQHGVIRLRTRVDEASGRGIAEALGLTAIHVFHYQPAILVSGPVDRFLPKDYSQDHPEVVSLTPSEPIVSGGADLRGWGFLLPKKGSSFGGKFVQPFWTGYDVHIAFVDSGIDCYHPDFLNTSNPATSDCGIGYSFVAGEPNWWEDLAGHGTFVASIASARGDGTHLLGAARRSWPTPYKVLDGQNRGSCDAAAAGADQATYDLRDVINLSIEVDDTPEAREWCHFLESAVNFATGAGLLVVGIAGNTDGCPSGVCLPGAYDNVLAVAAVYCGASGQTSQDQSCPANAVHAYYSAEGPEVDLAAPGSSVLGSTPRGTSYIFGYTGGALATDDGTSYAAPWVSAAATLLIEKYPAVRRHGAVIAAHLKATAYVPASGADANKYGAGILDISAALAVNPCVIYDCTRPPIDP